MSNTPLFSNDGLTLAVDGAGALVINVRDANVVTVPRRLLPHLAVVATEVARGVDDVAFDGCASPRYPCALCQVVSARCPNKRSPCRHHCHVSGCMR